MPPRLLKTLRAESTAFRASAMMDKPLGKYIHTPSILSTTKEFNPCCTHSRDQLNDWTSLRTTSRSTSVIAFEKRFESEPRSEQRRIESHAPPHLRNVVQIITETGLRVYKELTPMRKDQVDLVNATIWIPDSKTPNGIAEIPLTPLAIEAIKSQILVSGTGPYLFPSDKNPSGHQRNLKTAWRKTLKRAGVPYFRIYDLRSTYATRLSAGGVADEWVTPSGS